MAVNGDIRISVGSLDFRGGMNLIEDPTKLQDNQYRGLINARTRYGRIRPIKNPATAFNKAGNYQGVWGIGTLLVVAINGRFYYKDYTRTISFAPIGQNTLLDPTVDRIFAEAVPASHANLLRTGTLNENGVLNPSGGISLTSSGSGTPRCLVCQDGINRPVLIFPNGEQRNAQDFHDWSIANREYVPIGRQMVYKDGILYIVSPDGLEIYRSVTGRPLDYVIAVDDDANKLDDGLAIEARRLSHVVDFEPITALVDINTADGSLFVSTAKRSLLVVPDFSNLLFAEPTFSNQSLFPVGANNQYSIVGILGDTALITADGIHSFNAVLNSTNEGKNEPFSANVSGLFEGVVQDVVASTTFDSYAMFAVNTIYGHGILVYDMLRSVFCALDLYDVGPIKQFATIEIDATKRLFFITADGLYEFDASEITAPWKLYTKEWTAGNLEGELTLKQTRLFYQDAVEDGVITATPVIDKALKVPTPKNVIGIAQTENNEFPYNGNTEDKARSETFTHISMPRGHKVGILLEGNSDVDVLGIQLQVETNFVPKDFQGQAADR